MKIAIQNPLFIFADQKRNFNGYNLAFLKTYAHAVFLTRPWEFLRYRKRLNALGLSKLPIRWTTQTVDVLMHFDGHPYHRYRQAPRNFSGMKVWHTMDYVFYAHDSCQALRNSKVDYVMGYARHDQHCPFFQKYYHPFINRVIDVPFGFGERFTCTNTFKERPHLCLAAGAVNPVDDPLCQPEQLQEYRSFYLHEKWTHQLRRKLVENLDSLKPHLRSLLPKFPETKNPHYDPVVELNRHKLFVNDEGLLNFPPARTYEGIAAGAVMIANAHPIYEALGFKDAVNCFTFKKNDLDAFRRKLLDIQQEPEQLSEIQKRSRHLSEQFTHEKIAEQLYGNINKRFHGSNTSH